MNRPEDLMRRAVAIAAEKMRDGFGGPFGAVIARDDRIIAEGYNQVTSLGDPTAHAEVVAIREACRRLRTYRLEGCDIYTNCEPCPMCLGAIYWARLGRVYYANTRTDAAAIGFDDEHIYQEMGRSIDRRAIPFIHIDSDEARRVFREWMAKPDKVPY